MSAQFVELHHSTFVCLHLALVTGQCHHYNNLNYFSRSIYLKQPLPSDIRNIFLTSLAPSALLVTVLTLILLGCGFKLTIKLMKNEEKFKFYDSLTWCVGVLCQQGFHRIYRNSSSLTIMISALLFTLLLYNIFLGGLTSKLTYEPDPVQTVSDLNKHKFEIGLVRNSSDHALVLHVSMIVKPNW